ncbi:MAG: ABC transporter substrate-binding protein [Bacteroidales bacterium]|nr:ABC transporter substrate-binding protein [Bacteroidales bacterium]
MKTKIAINTLPLVLLIGLLASFLLLNDCVDYKKKSYKVGILSGLESLSGTVDGFKTKMAELGYIEGKNIAYDVQNTNFDIVEYRRILAKFINERVDLIFVFPTEAALEAKAATKGKNIPVVFANAFTENIGLVNSIREPGGNITGVRWAGAEIALKRFEIMLELAPKTKRILIAYQKDYPIVKSQVEILRSACATAGLSLIEIPASNAAELETELQKQSKTINSKTDFMLHIAEPLLSTPSSFAVLGKFAAEHKIPIGGTLTLLEGYESVFGLTPQSVSQGKQAAYLADKIFKGVKAGTIPVISAENFLQINYKEAEKFGLNLSEGLLSMANEIVR